MSKKKPSHHSSSTQPSLTPTLRNRIIGHRTVMAGSLKSHPQNPRTHSDGQKSALRALLDEVGYSRSVLAYISDADRAAIKQDPCFDLEHAINNAPLTLIDGHLRKDTLPNEPVVVEVLDVNDQEAMKLLLSIDPLAALAGFDLNIVQSLASSVQTDNQLLRDFWSSVGQDQKHAQDFIQSQMEDDQVGGGNKSNPIPRGGDIEEQYLVIITCSDEHHQSDVLRLVKDAGLKAKAVLS